MGHVPPLLENINTVQVSPGLPPHRLLFITIQPSATPLIFSMNTRRKNRSAHPGVPDMTPLQLLSAGLSHTPNARRPKKLTKDQQIAALRDELRTAQEIMSTVQVNPLVFACTRYHMLTDPFVFQGRFDGSTAHDDPVQPSPDAGGDTDPATDSDETYATVGAKRKAKKVAGLTPRCDLDCVLSCSYV